MQAITYLYFLFLSTSFSATACQSSLLKGAWILEHPNETQVLIFADDYFTSTSFDPKNKRFLQTKGGPYTLSGNLLTVQYEFSTNDSGQINKKIAFKAKIEGSELTTDVTGSTLVFKQADNGSSGLYGLWKITDRKHDGKLVPIHQQGTRKTIKILTSTRFQWAAIDPGTKKFMGTGGGTYSFQNGSYVENIEFFSRDNARTGQSLTFDGRLENGAWHHSGKSSTNEPIYEIWKR